MNTIRTCDSHMLSLAEANLEGVPSKARRLAQLGEQRTSQFRILPGLVATESGMGHEVIAARAKRQLGEGPFAVRSSAAIEDGDTESCAGRFLTKLNVDLADLATAIDDVFASYPDRDEGSNCVLIQPMLEPTIAGVAFSRAPDNAATACLEATAGTGDDVVSGRCAPKRATMGRYTGALESELDSKFDQVCERVFLTAALLERTFGWAQDVEWAYAGGHIWVLQSRDITATTDPAEISAEQSTWLAKLSSKKTAPALRASPTDEIAPDPSPMTRSLLMALYGDDGALGIALRQAGLPGVQGQYLHELFGQLYVDGSVEARVFGRSAWSWARWSLLRRRLRRNPDQWLRQVEHRVDQMEAPASPIGEIRTELHEAASVAARSFDRFVQTVYPAAFFATLLAHAAGPSDGEASTTKDLCSGFSRLHHTQNLDAFVEEWGHRAVLDYELSCPRYRENVDGALEQATRFADFPWADAGTGNVGFQSLKELAKDRAVAALGELRSAVRSLGVAATGDANSAFVLTIDDVRQIADRSVDIADVRRTIQDGTHREAALATVDLGATPDIHCVERLRGNVSHGGLRGVVLGSPSAFSGRIRFSDEPARQSDDASDQPEVLVTRTLEPGLVADFTSTAGCLTEVGGQLSHAAIVAREMGYSVVRLPGCSDTLRSGDLVEVTASGSVSIRPASRPGEARALAAGARGLPSARERRRA